jgi:diaminopimelate decarboxylase
MNLLWAGRDTVKLTKRYGLPLHVYDARRIVENLKSFQSVFQDTEIEGEVCYAVKACGFPEIINVAARAGAGADVASEFELAAVLGAGIPPEKLIIHGNAKSDAYIQKTMALGALIAANHHTELERIEAEAGRQGKIAKVLLRLSGFDLGPVTAAGIFTAGGWCKFGEPVTAIPSLMKSLGKWPHIDLIGFHVHIGSQIAEVEPYRAVLGVLAVLSASYREITGRPVQVLDLGGGFPVSYVNRQTWHNLVREIRKQHQTSDGNIKIGRSITWEGMAGGFRPDPKTGKTDWKHWSGEKFYSSDEKEKMLARLLGGRIPFEGQKVPAKKVLARIGSPRLIVEPGRAIVGDAGITLARVVDVYPVAGGHPLVTLDLGIVNHGNGLVEPDLYSWTLANDPDRKDSHPFQAFVAGRLCFSGDLLSRYKVAFPRRPVRGDIAVIEKTGAYAPTFFASRANGFPLPVQLLITPGGKTVRLLNNFP